MTDATTPLELRQREEIEFERARRRSQKFITFDTLAETFGQAEWQRFQRHDPLAFLRAKLDVQGGPDGLWLVAEFGDDYRSQVHFLFEWPLIQRLGGFAWCVTREIFEDDGQLQWVVNSAAYMLSEECGSEIKILVRGNRAAWEWQEDHKYDAPAGRPCPLPPRKRVAGEFCGTCKARFRTEDLAVLPHSDRMNFMLPCGHTSVGTWTEDVLA